ncbi:MAG: UDP binding domain-containing protein, partial [Anaerolineales bacterium]
VMEKIKAAIADCLAQRPGSTMADIKVACLGLAFKPDIDDLRESPAVEITKRIAEFGCQVLAVEPNLNVLPQILNCPNLFLTSLAEAVSVADVVCTLVKHREFVDGRALIIKHSKVIDPVGLLS